MPIATIKDLSAKAQENLEKNYADFKPTAILKVVARPSDFQFDDDTTAFWIELVNKNEHLVAVAMPNADLSIVKKEKVAN